MPMFNEETARWWGENPEEGARRAAEALRRLWALSIALKAYRDGEDRALWRFFEDYVEHRPDSLARTVVGRMITGSEELLVRPFLAFLPELGPRLGQKAKRARRPEAAEMYAALYKFPELRQALAGYEGDDDQYRRDLRVDEVLRALLDAEKRLQPGEAVTPSKLDWRIRADNQPSHESVDSPKRSHKAETSAESHNAALWHTAGPQEEKKLNFLPHIVRLDKMPELSKFFADPPALDAYSGVGDEEEPPAVKWKRLIGRAGLSPRELEVVALQLRGLKLEEIASRMGIAASTARCLWFRAKRKIVAVA